MKQTIFLTPINMGAGLYTVCSGFVRSLERQGLKVAFLKPFSHESTDTSSKLSQNAIAQHLSRGEEEKILEFLIQYTEEHSKECDIVVIEGLAIKTAQNYATKLNYSMALSLSADIVLVTSQMGKTLDQVIENIEIEASNFGGASNPKLLGCIINKVGGPTDIQGNTRIDLFDPPEDVSFSEEAIKTSKVKIIGVIPWKRSLMGTNVSGVKEHLGAKLFNENFNDSAVLHFALAAANIENVTTVFKPHAMIITSGDREDIIMASCLAYLSGVQLAGIVLTGGHKPSKETAQLCSKAIESGFPILLVETDSLRTAIALQNLNTKTIQDDQEHREKVNSYIAHKIDPEWVRSLKENYSGYTMSPAAFRYNLIEKAKAKKKTILLPEGGDIRVLKAAEFCAKRDVASIIILGKEEEIRSLAKNNGFDLHPSIKCIDPTEVAKEYVAPLMEIRKHKGLTEKNAIEYLTDPIVVGMMMLATQKVDGLVAGANTTTAKVLSPALKVLGTADGASLVSSIFFMCMQSEVLVYGDCAVNQNPTAEGLADIAIQSAETAIAFNIDPKVAMISYSTGSSGFGKEVEKVKNATAIVHEKCPNLICDGPLQYDAAKVPEIANKKAPESPVAGKANVFVFPDLNTANTTYKAVQRSAGVLSVGPILQGLRKPVNDLSRGANVEDIVFTIAITAIQG